MLERELDHLQSEHLSYKPDAKWPLLAVAWLKEAQVGQGGHKVYRQVQAAACVL